MSQRKKLEKILEIAQNDDLDDYLKLLKLLKKRIPIFGGKKRIAAALLKMQLGSISKLELTTDALFRKTKNGRIIFDDVKDGKARLFINVGKNHRVSTGDLIREIVRRSAIDGKTIGKIDLHGTYSFFEVPEQFAELVLLSFEDTRIKGVPVVVEPAKRKKEREPIQDKA